MKILITNIAASGRSGTEVVSEQLADGLLRAGHTVALYVSLMGPLARSMRERGRIVVDRLEKVPFIPDVIHGHHTHQVMAAVTAFPGVPALFLCHDATASWDSAPNHPQVLRYFAVDELCKARLVAEGVDRDEVTLLPNTVDLDRVPRRGPLPERPARGLIIAKSGGYEETIREACAGFDIELGCIGPAAQRVSARLGEVLQDRDIVFATARNALEAAAAGCAVILCDRNGMAGFLNAERWDRFRPWNLGRGILSHATTVKNVAAAIRNYDPAEAARTAKRVREQASLEDQLAQLETVYRELAEETRSDGTTNHGLARYLEDCIPSFRKEGRWREMLPDLETSFAFAEGVGGCRAEGMLQELEAGLIRYLREGGEHVLLRTNEEGGTGVAAFFRRLRPWGKAD